MKFLKKGKVKNAYIITQKEAISLWLYMCERIREDRHNGFNLLADLDEKKADTVYKVLKAAGCFK